MDKAMAVVAAPDALMPLGVEDPAMPLRPGTARAAMRAARESRG